MYPKSLEQLIEELMFLPGVGRKTAERYALHLLEATSEKKISFAKALIEVNEKMTVCSVCHNLSESDRCTVCEDQTRDQSKICVVASAKEVYSIEKTGQYHGLYHVLDGLISTRRGTMPEDLNITSLEERAKNTSEIILALNATVEGETTALYLSKKLGQSVITTRLAFGLPIGGQLDYADDMTLMKAFEGRKKM